MNILVVLSVLFAILIFVLFSILSQINKRKKLKSNGRKTIANIKRREERSTILSGPYIISNMLLKAIFKPKNDIWLIEYNFIVINRSYRKQIELFKKTCPIDFKQDPETIEIIYDPENPDINMPSFLLENKN